ncbi:hypothetical protein K503DRAFT_806712, partial [Rhizopogon vinicolor AM-OR11-026]
MRLLTFIAVFIALAVSANAQAPIEGLIDSIFGEVNGLIDSVVGETEGFID